VKADVLDILPEGKNKSQDSMESEDKKSQNESGLLNLSNTEKGWINFEGEVGGNTEYRITPKIEYTSDKTYEINTGAYVSYYNGDEFIKTVQQPEGAIEQVDDADNILVSYHYTFENKISLKEK